MVSSDLSRNCINCGRNDEEIPILNLSFQGKDLWICSACFPILIHKPEQLAGKLENAETLRPSSHTHD